MSFLLHHTRCEVPDASGDLLSFILLINGVCNLQTASARIIFSISPALPLILLWGPFRGANPPRQPGDRCLPSPRGPACPSGGGMSRGWWEKCVRSQWMRRTAPSVYEEESSAQRFQRLITDLPSQLQELNTFHFFYFIISVFCAGVKS